MEDICCFYKKKKEKKKKNEDKCLQVFTREIRECQVLLPMGKQIVLIIALK